MVGKTIGTVVVLGVIGTVGYFGASNYQTSQIEKEIATVLAEFEPQVSLDYASIESTAFSKRVEMHDAELRLESGETIEIDRLIVHDVDTNHEIPHHMHLSVEGVTAGDGAMGPQVVALSALGYNLDQMAGNMDLKYAYDESTKVLDLSVSQSVSEVGELFGQFVMGNAELSEEIPLEQQDVTLVSAELSYKDDSLVPRLYDFVSNMQQISVQEVEQLALGYVDQFQIFLPEGEFKRQAATAAAAFIQDPKSLRISVEPNSPLHFQELAQMSPQEDLDDIANLYGITITANSL